jgi:hypothetical protein
MRDMRCLAPGDRKAGNEKAPFLIFLNRCGMHSSSKGRLPQRSAYRMTPQLHTSTSGPAYNFPANCGMLDHRPTRTKNGGGAQVRVVKRSTSRPKNTRFGWVFWVEVRVLAQLNPEWMEQQIEGTVLCSPSAQEQQGHMPRGKVLRSLTLEIQEMLAQF